MHDSIEYVNIAYVENNSTSNTSVRLIAPKQLLLDCVQRNPYATLYPHKVVMSRPPALYRFLPKREEESEDVE